MGSCGRWTCRPRRFPMIWTRRLGCTGRCWMVVVLDNAATAEQVRPLLPGSPPCAVIVTSRNRLSGLIAREGAHRLTLDVLPAEDAVTLLRCAVGAERVDAEPEAAAEVARHCGYLPLALRIAAERAATRTHLMLACLPDSGQRTQ
jgi:NB-ARC domain